MQGISQHRRNMVNSHTAIIRSGGTQAGEKSNSEEGKHLPENIQLKSVVCFHGVSMIICLSNQMSNYDSLLVFIVKQCYRRYYNDYCDYLINFILM